MVKPDDEIQNKTVLSGVAHIMRCKNRTEVARLLSIPYGRSSLTRLNYNLRNYMDRAYNICVDTSGTVEYREATGSVSAEWVSAWTNICLGFFRFAREASDDRFRAVIEKLAAAEATARTGRPRKRDYDMVSLFFDMGLFAEALFLEGKLRNDPVRFWYPNTLGPEGQATSPAETRANPSSDGHRASPPSEYNVASSSDGDVSQVSTPFLVSPAFGNFNAPDWRPASPETFAALGWRPAGRRTSL